MVLSRKAPLFLAVACAAVIGVAHAQRGAPARGADAPQSPPADKGARSGGDRGAKTSPKTAAKDGEPSLARLPDEAGWRTLVENDARIGFTQRTAGEARAVLDTAAETTENQRAVALVGLGVARALVERTRLERVARSGSDLERRAAVLALGEMSASSDALFEEWIAKAEPPVAECALLALLRTDRPADRRRVEEIAADPKQRMSKAADEMLAFADDKAASKPTRATVLLLRLRFDAARQWGLVDGETWEGLAVRKLAGDPQFVRDVVLASAAGLRGTAARDHVFVELIRGLDLTSLRAAIAVLPSEVSDLVDAGLWKPADSNQWSVMLDEIGMRHLERFTLPFLRAAMQDENVRAHAVALSANAGDEDMTALLGTDIKRLSPDDRAWIALAVGSRSETELLERFAPLARDESARVRMAWLVAQLRQGTRHSAEQVDNKLNDPDSPDHRPLVLALCAAARDPNIADVLEDWLPNADEDETSLIAIALGIEGRMGAHARVRDALSVEPPPQGLLAVRLVRALRHSATPEDLLVLRRLFPSVSGDRALDRELVIALLEHNEPEAMPILRAALWSSEQDISLLAGGLIAQTWGIHTLIGELHVPPAEATSRDLRRVGFAVGEWGGVAAVELLARDLRWASGEPALQGALLGVLSTRTQ